jgi:hypothetical protein
MQSLIAVRGKVLQPKQAAADRVFVAPDSLTALASVASFCIIRRACAGKEQA